MALEKSVFVDTTIKSEVEKNYGSKVDNISKIDRGNANLFLLTVNEKKYVLKEFQSYYSEAIVKKEAKIIKYLENENISVPTYILTLSGKFCFKYCWKVIILQKYIKGYIKEICSGTKEQILESAKFLGMIVKSLEAYPNMESDNIKRWHSEINYVKSILIL